MAQPSNMPRSPSETSSSFSVIHVASATKQYVHSTDDHSRQSTPLSMIASRSPTPVDSSMTSIDVKEEKQTITTGASRKRKGATADADDSTSSRNVSGLTGVTLIDEEVENENTTRLTKKRKVDGANAAAFPKHLPPRPNRRRSVRETMKQAAHKVRSVLGKRTRNDAPTSKLLKELDTGSRGLLQELDLEAEDGEDDEQPRKRPTKKIKREESFSKQLLQDVPTPKPITKGKLGTRKAKLWLASGLYAGQDITADRVKQEKKSKLQKDQPESDGAATNSKPSFMSMPMFGFLDHHRDFTIPFDVFAPTYKKGDAKPKDWHQLNRNRLVGEAKELWEKEAPLARSLCICARPKNGQLGCDDDCLNRAMHYECDSNNCGLQPEECSNRAFTSLARRVKKGGAFDVGVEVVATPNRGFGVRACREFAPGEIIMEYTGEIISEAECQRRMRDVYAGKHCYYIMEFDQGLHIDGTKGSMARFVNHSCEPNCEVRMVKVSGTPRMAIFAGDQGVFTGEELTYDYNFDNFGENKQACFCGAQSCRGHLARRLNAAEQKIRDREEKERQQRAEEEAKRVAAEKLREKETKAKRGSGWRGWVTLGEIKEDLKQQKAAREEAERNSSRAQRLAARKTGAPLPASRRVSNVTTKKQQQAAPAPAPQPIVVATQPSDEKVSRPQHKRSASSTSRIGQSKFAEHIEADDELGALVSESFARIEAMERSWQREVEREVENEIELSEKASHDSRQDKEKKGKSVKSSTAKASSLGKAVLKTVEKAVVDGLKQGKVRVMRQSTLSFTKIA